MKRNLPKNAVPTVVAISLLLCFTLSEGALAQGNRGDEEAIRTLLSAWTEASNSHDAKAGTVFFTRNADYVNVFGSGPGVTHDT